MSIDRVQQADLSAPARYSIKTIYLFGALAIVSTFLAWANNEFVMTKEVLRALAGNPENTLQVDIQYESVRSMAAWGYLFTPIHAALRIGLVALVVQMICLLVGREIPFRRIFRIAAIAFWATQLGSLLQILWVTLQPVTAITQGSVGIVPDSLAAWFGPTGTTPSLLQLMLSRVSITSLLWTLLLYRGLLDTNCMRPTVAAAVSTATWCMLSVVQVSTALLVRELLS